MDQHLVDDILEKERCREAEQVDRERDQQHFADQTAIFDDLRDEPGKVEGAIVDAQRLARGDEHKLARPDRIQFLARQLGDIAVEMADEHLVRRRTRD